MILRRELLAFPFELQSAPAPRILLNHFYATVDRATYRAIAADTFLQQQFAPFEERTTVRSDSTYSGLYFYGDQTYFEFFEENQGGRKPGDAGLALGSEDPGGSAWLKAQWGKLRPSINTMTTRQLDGSAIDWFETTSFQETRERSLVEGLRVFGMQYAPGFVAKWHEESAASIAQRDILAAYCAKLKMAKLRETSLLENVTHVTIASPEAGIRTRAAQLEAAGWSNKSSEKGLVSKGPNFTVDFRFATRIVGVTEVEMSLKHSSPKSSRSIGKTELEIRSNRRAIWRIHS